MCDKNCGSSGTEVCTCRCLQVTAYKSKSGTIYEKKEDCQKANETFDKAEEQRRQKVLIEKVKGVILETSGYTQLYHEMNYHQSYYDREQGFADCITRLAGRWKILREALNGIQD